MKAKEPKPKTCGECKHFEMSDAPVNYTAKGNPRPSASGQCNWYQSATFPMAIIRAGERNICGRPYVSSIVVCCDTNAETCQCWEGK